MVGGELAVEIREHDQYPTERDGTTFGWWHGDSGPGWRWDISGRGVLHLERGSYDRPGEHLRIEARDASGATVSFGSDGPDWSGGEVDIAGHLLLRVLDGDRHKAERRVRWSPRTYSSSEAPSTNAGSSAGRDGVRWCALVIGSGGTEMEELGRTIDGHLQGHGLVMTAPPIRWSPETISAALDAVALSDVCLLVYDGELSDADEAFVRRMGIFEAPFNPFLGSTFQLLVGIEVSQLPTDFQRLPTFRLTARDMLKAAQAAKAHVDERDAGRRRPLGDAAPLIRERMKEVAGDSQAAVAGATGESVYISYARDAAAGSLAPRTAEELGRRGVTVLIGAGETLGIQRAEWYALFVDEAYGAGARGGETALALDNRDIEAEVLRNPLKRERVIPLLVSDSAETGHPRLILGLDRVRLREASPTVAADAIQRAMDSNAKAQTRPVPVEAIADMEVSTLVRTILQYQDWIARGSVREPLRTPTGALVLAMIHLGLARPGESQSAAWLASHLNGRKDGAAKFAREYFPHWSVESLGTEGNERETPTLALSYNVYSIILWARLLAERTRDGNVRLLHAAHLLVALLHRRAPWTANAEKAMREIGLDPEQVRRRLARDLPKWELGGDRELWNLWDAREERAPARGARAVPRWIARDAAASLSADDHRIDEGQAKADPLDIQPDVEAFAKVLASWDLEPPLALGLFGDWGSGKTYFMKRLKTQIEKHSLEAREDAKPQRELPYCKYIVQVEFNAWHYSEGDLWACLVDHIFTNLRLTEKDSETEVARRRKAMLAQMQALQRTGDTESQKQVEAEKAIAEAQTQAEAAERKLHEAQAKFTELSVKDIWSTVTKDEKLQAAVRKHLEALGVNAENAKTAAEIKKAIEEAKSLGGRVRQAWRFLWSQKGNLYAWGAFALALGAPAFLLWLSTRLEPISAQIGVAATGVLSAIAGFLPIYRSFASRVGEVLDQLDKPRRMAEEARRLELRAVEEEIAKLTIQRDEAESRKRDIEKQKEGLQKQIDELNADRMLAEFLQDRAASDDYRKKLGTLALIRRDFERLADLMRTQREEERKPESGPRSGENAIPESLRVNRIVLYIDDLDRCSPKQVMDVLQAIHLLLAFPLFVVVVGVDARWVYRSIRVRSRDLLRADAATEDDWDDEEGMHFGGLATPHDYLEKIFQVPFWLQPMSAEACKKLIGEILKPQASAARGEQATNVGAAAASGASTGKAGGSATALGGGGGAGSDRKAAEAGAGAPTSKTVAGAPAQAATPSRTPAGESRTERNAETPASKETAKPRALELETDEVEWMRELAPIVGRSPRAVKRFVNCYRLFKAVLPEQMVEGFVMRSGPEGVSHAQFALFLLATIVGAPAAARHLIGGFQSADPNDTIADCHRELSAGLGKDSPDATPEVREVFGRITRGMGDATVETVRPIIDRAARFSFRSAAIADELTDATVSASARSRSSTSPAGPA